MLSRVLRDRAGQLGALGFAGVAIVVGGAALDSWRIAAVGAGVALVIVLLMLSNALMVVRAAPVPRSRETRSTAQEVAGGRKKGPKRESKGAVVVPDEVGPVVETARQPGDGSGLLDELRLVGVVEQTVHRLGLAEDVARLVSIEHAVQRREQADLVRLVTREDTSPSLPVDVRLSATTLMSAVNSIREHRPARVLVVAPGVASLWLARAVTDGGGRLDIACDPSESEAVDEMVRHRGLAESVRTLVCPRQVPDVPAAVRPWIDLSGLTDVYDLVVVLPRDAREARAASPALEPVLARVAPAGAILVAGPAGPDRLGRAWSVRHEVVVSRREAGPVAADGISRDDAVLLRRAETSRADAPVGAAR